MTMRSKTKLFALAAVLSIAGIGALGAAAYAERRMVPVSTTIKEIVDGLDRAIRDDMARCTAGGGRGETSFCDGSGSDAKARHDAAIAEADALTARPAAARRNAEANIRRFAGNGRLALTYVGTSSDPYRDDDSRIETYVDDNGHEYWVDPEDDGIVQVGPGPDSHPAPFKDRQEGRLPVPELRSRAMRIAAAAVPGFDRLRSGLHPLEDNKDGEIYFFRWDDPSPAAEDALPPFVQVGLWADGELASFTDTLTK